MIHALLLACVPAAFPTPVAPLGAMRPTVQRSVSSVERRIRDCLLFDAGDQDGDGLTDLGVVDSGFESYEVGSRRMGCLEVLGARDGSVLLRVEFPAILGVVSSASASELEIDGRPERVVALGFPHTGCVRVLRCRDGALLREFSDAAGFGEEVLFVEDASAEEPEPCLAVACRTDGPGNAVLRFLRLRDGAQLRSVGGEEVGAGLLRGIGSCSVRTDARWPTHAVVVSGARIQLLSSVQAKDHTCERDLTGALSRSGGYAAICGAGGGEDRDPWAFWLGVPNSETASLGTILRVSCDGRDVVSVRPGTDGSDPDLTGAVLLVDPAAEDVCVTSDGDGGLAWCTADGRVERRVLVGDPLQRLRLLLLSDMDGDGRRDIGVASGTFVEGESGVRLLILSAADGSVLRELSRR